MVVTTERECNFGVSGQYCEWRVVGGIPQCASKCVTEHTTEVGCNADPMCSWQRPVDMCNLRCEYIATSANGCAVLSDQNNTSTCAWNSYDNVCSENCSQFLDPASCSAAPQCQFNWVAGACTLACHEFATRAGCASQPALCAWDGADEKCVAVCADIPSQVLCAANPSCMWDPAMDDCVIGCKDAYPNPAACASNPLCRWSVTRGVCEIAGQ